MCELLKYNPNKGPCPGFCGGSGNSYCCSKDQTGTLRCPKGAKFAVTSDTNSCVTLEDIPDDDDSFINESDDEDDVNDTDDPNTTMLIETPQVDFCPTRKLLDID